MFNVLRAQLYRLKKSKLFWAMVIVCAVLPLLGALFMTAIFEILGNFSTQDGALVIEVIKAEGGEMTMEALSGLTQLGSNAALLSLICSSIFLSGEFSGGAIRNMVLANKSRTQIFLSFLSVALIIGFACFGAGYLSTLLWYGSLMGFGGLTVQQALTGCFTSLFLGLLSIAVVQACVCLFLFCTRKTGATVAFPILFIIIAPSLVTAIVEIVLSVKVALGQSVSTMALSWIPLANMELFDAAAVDGATVGKIALYNLPIAAIFAFFGWFAISKVDLK